MLNYCIEVFFSILILPSKSVCLAWYSLQCIPHSQIWGYYKWIQWTKRACYKSSYWSNWVLRVDSQEDLYTAWQPHLVALFNIRVFTFTVVDTLIIWYVYTIDNDMYSTIYTLVYRHSLLRCGISHGHRWDVDRKETMFLLMEQYENYYFWYFLVSKYFNIVCFVSRMSTKPSCWFIIIRVTSLQWISYFLYLLLKTNLILIDWLIDWLIDQRLIIGHSNWTIKQLNQDVR